jgi:hypothetical protein
MLIGVFENHNENRFMRIYQNLSPKALKGGKVVKTLAFDDSVTIKKLYAKIDSCYLYQIYIYSQNGNLKKIIEPQEVVDILQSKAPYEKLI